MAISNVIQRGCSAYIYDEKGKQTGMVSFGSNDSLQGFTATSVSIKRGMVIHIYNEKGRQTGTVPAR